MPGWPWGRGRAERELEEELQFHLEQASERYGSRRRAEALLGGLVPIAAAVAHFLQAGVDAFHQLAIGGDQVADQPHHVQ